MSRESNGAMYSGNSLQLASAKELETPLPSGMREDKVQLWQWFSFPICALLVVLCLPYMSFGLYKKSIQDVLVLSSEEVQEIVSYAQVGGLVLGFIPGLVYDACGYTVTLISGGVMATSGAFLWYWLLADGGEPGSPTWYGLGLALMLMCHGCRYHYTAAMCAILCVFPQRLIGTVAASMAVCISLGYIILPGVWSFFFLPSDTTDPKEYNPVSGNLANLKAVSSLYLLLSVFYACVTVSGTTIARWLKPKESGSVASSLRQRLRRLRDPAAMALAVNTICTLGFISAFYTSGVAEAAHHAGAAPAEVGEVLGRMGMFGLVGRFFFGLGSDFLRSCTPAGQAGQEVMIATAVSGCLMGFCLIIAGDVSWTVYAYLIAFCHGGLWALFPAAVRGIFPKDELGFWLGSLTSLLGMLTWVYGRLGAALDWDSTIYVCASVGAFLTILGYLPVICIHWGKQ